MIKIDGKVFATLELAMPFFSLALKVEVYNLPRVTAIPDLPAATEVCLYNLPLVTAIPDLPAATEVSLYNLPLVKPRQIKL